MVGLQKRIIFMDSGDPEVIEILCFCQVSFVIWNELQIKLERDLGSQFLLQIAFKNQYKPNKK